MIVANEEQPMMIMTFTTSLQNFWKIFEWVFVRHTHTHEVSMPLMFCTSYDGSLYNWFFRNLQRRFGQWHGGSRLPSIIVNYGRRGMPCPWYVCAEQRKSERSDEHAMGTRRARVCVVSFVNICKYILQKIPYSDSFDTASIIYLQIEAIAWWAS